MKITILTLFPEMFTGPFQHSILKRAQEKGAVEIKFVNIREFGIGKHKMVDDTIYGGGVGMLMRVDVLYDALASVKDPLLSKDEEKIILTSAGGETYTQKTAKAFSGVKHLIIICGHYEGVDERILSYIDKEISIGEYVLTGGEIPAMVITDSIVRLLPGVITTGATENESFSLIDAEDALLEYPQYTKPQTFREETVPDVLLTGNHKHINEWRLMKAKEKTSKRR